MRTRTATLVLTTGLALGTVGSLALTPALAAAADATTQGTSRIATALKGLVSDGTLTQAQADKVATTLEAALPKGGPDGRGGPGGHGGPRLLDAAATVLGTTPDALRTQLGTTKSLADLAGAKGISKADLVSKLTAAVKADLAAKVKAGALTQAEADQRTADLTAKVTELVDRVGLPVRGDHGPMGAPPAGAPAAPAPSATTS